MAMACLEALIRGDDAAVTPLVLHGPSGVGKTRLLSWMVEEWIRHRPDSTVASLDGDQFAQTCAEAARHKEGWAELRDRFRSLDLLALDDAQALTRFPWHFEELTHTIDSLLDSGAVVVLSALASPNQWNRDGWPRRLINRLTGGLAVPISPPSAENRRRYTLERIATRRMKLPAEIIDVLAEAADGYRTLDGWLARLELTGKVSRPAVHRLLEDSLIQDDLPLARALPAIEQIAGEVAARYRVSVKALRSASRRAAVVEPRHLAIHLARCWTGLSFAAIGRYFGGRDPATIRHACRAAQARIAGDPALAALVEALNRHFRGSTAASAIATALPDRSRSPASAPSPAPAQDREPK